MIQHTIRRPRDRPTQNCRHQPDRFVMFKFARLALSTAERRIPSLAELCGIFGDGVNQAAALASGTTSIPSRTVTGLAPGRRRMENAAARMVRRSPSCSTKGSSRRDGQPGPAHKISDSPLLCSTRGARHSGVTQTKWPPANPGRFIHRSCHGCDDTLGRVKWNEAH
jgi:hypothetical protein